MKLQFTSSISRCYCNYTSKPLPFCRGIINKTTPSQGQWCNLHHPYNSQHIQTILTVPIKEVQSRLTSAVNTRGHITGTDTMPGDTYQRLLYVVAYLCVLNTEAHSGQVVFLSLLYYCMFLHLTFYYITISPFIICRSFPLTLPDWRSNAGKNYNILRHWR